MANNNNEQDSIFKWQPGEVASLEWPAGTSFAYSNGLYVVLKTTLDGMLYLCKLDSGGNPTLLESTGMYSTVVTGVGNSNLKKTLLTCQIHNEKI